MSKGYVEIEIFRAYKGAKYVWFVTIDNNVIDHGAEDTYKEALKAVEVCLDIWQR